MSISLHNPNLIILNNQLNIFCFLLLVLLMIKISLSRNKIKYYKNFNFILFTGCIVVLLDNIVILAENTKYLKIFTAIHSTVTIFIIYCFFRYYDRMIHFNLFNSLKYRLVFFSPYLLGIIGIIKGDIAIYNMIVNVMFITIASTLLFCMGYYVFRINRFYIDRHHFIIYPIIVIVGAILHNLFISIPMSASIVFASIICYIDGINLLISKDSLTRINNRYNLIDNITYKIKQSNRNNKPLYIVMIDVDKFKRINDEYGHIEGDLCLIRIADSIKEVCNNFRGDRAFICRYGGDEFLIAVNCTLIQVKEIISSIKSTLAEKNIRSGAKYTINISAGYAKYDYSNEISIKKLIEIADENMYKEKYKKYNKKEKFLG
jgi:diguanylate cyclase (GGDEF)-like protein